MTCAFYFADGRVQVHSTPEPPPHEMFLAEPRVEAFAIESLALLERAELHHHVRTFAAFVIRPVYGIRFVQSERVVYIEKEAPP